MDGYPLRLPYRHRSLRREPQRPLAASYEISIVREDAFARMVEALWLGQPATADAWANRLAGMARCRRQVKAIGRSPSCDT